ncbi:hypothetical protein PCCS19_25050 [Paenibacillus sp. CCS19]|nr:hypothetical protein PCCS19_25050 [Paenibacillus cellulosilyticus]
MLLLMLIYSREPGVGYALRLRVGDCPDLGLVAKTAVSPFWQRAKQPRIKT